MVLEGRIETTMFSNDSMFCMSPVGFDMGEKSARPTQPTDYF
jgi:hypothetical protein